LQWIILLFRKLAVRAMRQLRVMDMYHAAFVKYNEKTHRLLKVAEPYITWGAPDVRTIRDLLTKRGFAEVDVSLEY
jgi:large subunit ribosomal protein L7e